MSKKKSNGNIIPGLEGLFGMTGAFNPGISFPDSTVLIDFIKSRVDNYTSKYVKKKVKKFEKEIVREVEDLLQKARSDMDRSLRESFIEMANNYKGEMNQELIRMKSYIDGNLSTAAEDESESFPVEEDHHKLKSANVYGNVREENNNIVK